MISFAASTIYAQCDFDVSAVMQKESDCQSNGIILATLSGQDVISGNIDIGDAKFGISSTTTSYVQPPVSNGGVITNVPPGTYEVTVQAYCKKSNSWQVKTFSTVTVTGSYTVPNINNIKIISANIKGSLMCAPTGSIPINVEGGRPPYTITISSAPPGYSGPTSFIQPTEGVITIPDLPAGTYSFEVQDNCTYTLYGLPPATVNEIKPVYTIDNITHTAVCATNGKVSIGLKDGVAPYTIEMVDKPLAYLGITSFTVLNDGVLDITGLNSGIYKFKVKDKCYEETLTAIVNEIPLVVVSGAVTGTTTCENSGSVEIGIEGGLPPYVVNINSSTAPSCYTGPWTISYAYDPSNKYLVDGLCEGSYDITVRDACGTSNNLAAINIVVSHLDVALVDVKDATASCLADGSATISIVGGKPPYKVKLITPPPLYYADPGTLNIPNAISDYKINNLSPGYYEFEFEDACGEKDTVEITIDFEPFEAIIQTVVSSFECVATGQLIIEVTNGKPPYTVDMISQAVVPPSPPYTGPTSIPPATPPDGNIFVVNNLPNGTYEFKVIDACGEEDIIVGLVDSLPVKYDYDFYKKYFIEPNPKDNSCKDVVIRRNKDATGALGQYWNSNPGDYYEVAFEENINLPKPLSSLDWNPVTSPEDTTFTLSRGYCQMRSDDGYIVVFLRVKDDNAFLCDHQTDTIWMDELKTLFSPPYDESCNGYSINFENTGLFCFPYSWELQDLNNGNAVVDSKTGINDREQTVINIPYGKHLFKFTDNENCSWYSDILEYYWSPPPIVDTLFTPDCGFYKMEFTIENVCPPFEWRVLDQTSSIVASNSFATVGLKETVLPLTYGHDYVLEIIYKGGLDVLRIPFNKSAARFYNYQMSFEPCYCLPDTGKGAIVIHRDPAMLHFEKGTIIEYISGPTIPKHRYIYIDDDNVEKVFPFSTDSLMHSFQDILPGRYEFKLTDVCSVVHPLVVQYEIATLSGLGYTKDETCSGVKIHPEGTIYLGSTALPTYFRISSAPFGIAVDDTSITSTGTPNYLFLPESGQYEIQVSTDNSSTSCPFDKFIIDYAKLSVCLDADSTEAYVCEAGSVGYIKVVRKGGIGPFEYELFDQGVSVGKNSLGRFSYGSPGNAYTIRVKDNGCQVSFDQDIMLINLANERLIYGTSGYCPGNIIELNCLSVNNTSGYYWTGPDGYISTDQHPRIYNADSTHQGIYTLSVQPEGCTGPIRQTIEALNHQPANPIAEPVSVVCLHTRAEPLKASASSDENTLKWYDTNGTTSLSYAPTPSTAKVDTITYYVSQVNSIWGCEGEKIPVRAAIADLPSIDLSAQAPPICPGTTPTIILPETNSGYTYSLYTAYSGGKLLGISYSSGDTVKISSATPLMDDATFYVEVIDSNACISPDRKAVRVSTENYLEIKPDALPEYQRGKPYSVQLESNAIQPATYSSDYGLPLGFSLTEAGLISGAAPGKGYIEPKSFDVRLKDANGCVATKLYLLKGDPFIPNTFTPNGDGYNDIFMKGHHLIIFDRLGVVIFEGNDGWDGTRNNGKKAPPDTYFYILDYEHDDGLISKRKGYITLLERE